MAQVGMGCYGYKRMRGSFWNKSAFSPEIERWTLEVKSHE